MKFKRETLQELASGDVPNENYKIISEEIVDTTRWSVIHYLTFSFHGQVYGSSYRRGATEYQDESPYEYDEDEIDCDELFAKQITTTVYVTKDKL